VRRSNGDKKRVAQEEQYTKASEARQQIAAKEYEDVRNLLASAMQKNSLAGSPFMDEVMKRTIMKRLIENPGAINKLTNPQG
jgi:translation initiation factor RLI1